MNISTGIFIQQNCTNQSEVDSYPLFSSHLGNRSAYNKSSFDENGSNWSLHPTFDAHSGHDCPTFSVLNNSCGIFNGTVFCNFSSNLVNASESINGTLGSMPFANPLGVVIYLVCDTAITGFWSVLANLLVMIFFARDPKLRIIQNYYIVSLALSDWFMGAFVLPLGAYNFIFQGWPVNSIPLCKFWNVMDFVMSLQSSLSVCLINYDRYKMVLHPIAYRNEETPRRALARICTTWAFSIVFYAPVNLFWDIWVGHSNNGPQQCEAEFKDIAWLTITQACVEFGCPLVLLCYCNIRLFTYIRMRGKKMVSMRKGAETPVTEATSTPHESTPHKSLKKAVAKDEEKNNAEYREFKREQRAVRSLLVLVGTYFCLWFW